MAKVNVFRISRIIT